MHAKLLPLRTTLSPWFLFGFDGGWMGGGWRETWGGGVKGGESHNGAGREHEI